MSDAVIIKPVDAKTIKVPIIGTSPLIMHRFSEKMKKQMLDSFQGRKNAKQPKDPAAEFKASMYRLGRGYGFPAVGFKAATVSAARFYNRSDVTMTGLRQLLFFHGEIGDDGVQLVKIEPADKRVKNNWPLMREDVVRINNGRGTDLRYRGSFFPWRAELEITFVESSISTESVLALVQAGGLTVGVGEWRPGRGGEMGTYQIDEKRKMTVVRK